MSARSLESAEKNRTSSNRPRFAAASFFCLSTVFATLGCAGTVTDEDAEDALTGGKVAKQGDFASTLRVTTRSGGCTGAKVGPAHVLLAAHCVHDGKLAAGETIEVNDGVVPKFDREISLRVKAVHVPHFWTSRPDGVLDSQAPPDVAVIEVERSDAFEALTAAAVDLSPVTAGEELTVTGYGCEKGLKGGTTSPRLKTHTTKAEPFETVERTSAQTPPARLPTSYFFTPGKGLSLNNASICPGDSGGPVYRGKTARGRELSVVGVNAYYGFTDGGNVSSTNWHTRLDTRSRVDVGSWLATLGVRVKGALPHTDHYRACIDVGGVPVCGALRASWEARGGLAKLGAPVTQARLDPVAAGAVWTQTFGTVKLEVDASLPAPEVNDVRESAPPAANDPCHFARGGDKTYCGNVLVGADPKTLYTCEGTLTVATRACPKGCSWKGVCEP